jgi:CopG family nickel-responsive transcriptional regulator
MSPVPPEVIMPEVVRFSISTDERLLMRFDDLIAEKGYVNRSEAVRDLIRSALVEDSLANDESESVGTVTLVYDHHFSDLGDKLTEHQHTHHESIVSTLHIHLDHHNCLEVVVLRGKAAEVKRLADSLISTKGVKHGRFVATAATADLV